MEQIHNTSNENHSNESEILQESVRQLLSRVSQLEDRLRAISKKNASEKDNGDTTRKLERLDCVRHSVTEYVERMQRPYVVSQELQTVKTVLDTLAETGDCNSVILEGEPGTGKTQWAYSEAGQEIQNGQNVALIHVRVKDSMRAQDMLYTTDNVRRLSDAQARVQIPDQIKQEAEQWKQKIIDGTCAPTDVDYVAFKSKMDAVTSLSESSKNLNHSDYIDLGPLGEAIYQSGKGIKVYLLIDEIEKGREELMTGILDEIENLTFTVSETGEVIKGNKKNLRIIITTNPDDSDKIPPSFRRRSLYHYIDYPSRSDMAKIIECNIPNIQKDLMEYAIAVFYQFHENEDIQKKPSTPELLAWIRIIMQEYNGKIPADIPHSEILLKYKADIEIKRQGQIVGASEIVDSNLEKRLKTPRFLYAAHEGRVIHHFSNLINDRNNQERFSSFYAALSRKGINYQTPIFDENYQGYGEDKPQAEFRITHPGFQDFGDGYYEIPPEYVKDLYSSIDTESITIPDINFSKIEQSGPNFEKGTVAIGEQDYEGWKIKGRNEIIAFKPFEN